MSLLNSSSNEGRKGRRALRNSRPFITLLAGLLLASTLGTSLYPGSGSSIPQFPTDSGAWNPKVPCTPPWIVRITDITNNQTGSTSLTNSLFNPGITSPVGTAKRWLAPGPTPSGWVSPGPPCTITNSHGTVATFVEIDGIKRGSITNEDCTGNYDAVNGGTSNGGSYCDSTFNMYDPSIVTNYSTSCTSATDPTCYGRIHVEIDHDWKAAGYCGPSTTCDDGALGSQTTTSSPIDIQGFISWDPGNLAQQWHSFNGWEIHPLTGWRLHQSSASPDFSVSAAPTGISTLASTVATSTITVAPLNGFTGTVALAPAVSPAGLACAVNPTSIVLGTSQTSTLSCSGPAGTYTVTVGGTSGSLSHSTVVLYAVTDFNISASPKTVALNTGGTGTSTVTVASVNGFTGIVSLSRSVSPFAGLSCSLSPASIAGSGTSTLSCTGLSNGLYTVTVTGAAGSLSHSTTVSYNITATTDFSITVNPTSLAVDPGVSANSTVTIAPVNGFTGTVSVAASVSPSGLTCTLNPTSVVLGGSQTSTLSCSGPGGTYTVTVTGTSGSLSHSATVTYNVAVPDFTIVATPSTATVTAGSTGAYTITTAPFDGFAGTVTLASSSSPGGLSCSLNPPSIVLGGSQNSTLLCSGSSRVYSVTVTGSSSSLSHSTTVTFTVQDFTVSANPTIINTTPNSTSTSTITFTSMNGFTGTIFLTLSSSNGLTASLTPASVTLTSGGTASSTLTIRSATVGNYTAIVSGTSGSPSHSISIPIVVADFSISASPTTLNLSRSSTASSLVTLTSLNGFSGTMTLTVTISPSGPKASLSPTTITLAPSSSGTSTLTIKTLRKTPVGSYTVTITATSGSLTHTITIQVTVT